MRRCPNNSNLNLNLISLKINNKHSVITTKKKKYSKLIFLILRKHQISLRGKQEYKRTKNLDVKSSRPEPRSFNRVHKLLAQSSDIGHYDHKMPVCMGVVFHSRPCIFMYHIFITFLLAVSYSFGNYCCN